jgi:uncharacterized protein YukE
MNATADQQPPAVEADLDAQWERLGVALSESSTALADQDRTELVKALESLADACPNTSTATARRDKAAV